MSNTLYSQGEKRTNRTSSSAGWRKVLEIGEQLLRLSQIARPYPSNDLEYNAYPDRGVILAQRDLIIETATGLVGGQAELWLPGWLGLEIGYLHHKSQDSRAISEQIARLFSESPPSPLARQAVESRQPCSGNSNKKVTALSLPLLGPAEENELPPVLGILSVQRPMQPAYKRAEIELLAGLAVQAAIALQTSRQMAIERWRVEQLSLVREVSLQLLADMRDLDELARRVTHLILATFDYYYVAIFTREPDQELLHFRASAGPGRPSLQGETRRTVSPTLTVCEGDGLIGTVAQTGQEILANDVSLENRFLYYESLPETRSEFTLPIKIGQRVLGVLDVQSDLPDDFHSIDVLVLRTLAGNIALAVEGSRLYSDLQRRVGQLSSISEVGNAISSILDQDKLLQQVVCLIHDRFGFPFVHLFSVHPGRGKIFFEAGAGQRSQTLAEQRFSYDLNDPKGLIPWTAQHGQTALVNDVSQDNRYRPAPIFPQETLAELTIPLKFGDDVLGVLDIQSERLNAFDQAELFLFEALADNIAIAMRNASLYRSEQWRRQVADSLSEVAGLISAEVGLDQVLDATLVELERNLPCDLAAIWFLEEDQPDTKPGEVLPNLRLAAVRGVDASWLIPQIGLELDEILEPTDNHPAAGGENRLPGWLFDAFQSEQPVARSGDAPIDSFGVALEFPADYSAIAAALRVGDKRLGLLILAHHTSGRYGGEARTMTAAFASYASVAIQNARLYESAHEQVWVSTVLLQVAEATRSQVDLNDLLATVVQITPMLVGVKACAIYLASEDGVFSPAVASGLKADSQNEFGRRRFAPGDLPALDHLWNDKRPTIIQNQGEDLRLASLFAPETTEGDILELLVLAPLLARGEVLGALLVQYSGDPLKSAVQALENFFDERLPILQGIAHQTATAVENIRLVKSQKEEAYVSVALLQVAQAIVSSSDLQETLGAIVRITPILTGVKRVAIFLLERKTPPPGALRLVQSYGLPRDADTYPYAVDEFPLLEMAIQHDAIVAYPLNATMDDEWEDVPEVWTYLPAPDPEEMAEYLSSEARLLIAIPLTVKGEVLGALVVEEPDQTRSGEQAASSSNLRLRPKRLEITTGISQQIALAAQNDQLKGEIAIRERLEREMQLAREIQRTFLPSQFPDLPGWELKVWWRTAREMGGDFYDLFDLPGGRLGLVMADVADKGLPAALFMVLTRTLLRASAKDSLSPAETLAEVNDLLVPDANQGMFVTLWYAVFEPLTGRLTYANAGHNPPLWVRWQEQTIELLTKSGMALGVQEEYPIAERSLTLEPGDYLVMYTDGVTDAFSPEGLTYGSERLCQSVWEAAFNRPKGSASAQSMLQAIDASVEGFMRGEPSADDSTVLILFRQPS